MSYPVYEKIEIDPDQWPDAYWDSCMSCETCDTNWPEDVNFEMCPDCHVETQAMDFRPTYRWPDAVKRLLNARFEDWYAEIGKVIVLDEVEQVSEVKENAR